MPLAQTIGKPYAGNPHVRFDEGLLVRASRTADWGLLLHRLDGRGSAFTQKSLGAGRSDRMKNAAQAGDTAWGWGPPRAFR
jgi:hypothetical protein